MKTVYLAAAALLLAGCSVGPDYVRPETPAPTSWQGQGEAAWPDLDWWKTFGTPQLDALMADARAANFDLAAAQARIRQADAQAKIAGGALYPALNGGVGAQRSRTPATTRAQARSTPNPDGASLFSTVFTASYEIDFWGKNQATAEAAEALARASRFDSETTRLTVQANVANTFFLALSYRDRLEVANANLANAEHVLAAIRARAEVGTAAGLDIAQQETVVAEQKATVAPLVQGLRQTGYALATLIGKTPDGYRLPGIGLTDIKAPAVVAGIPSGLLGRRPDVGYAESQLMSANANWRAAEAAVLPSVNLTGQGGIESIALSSLLEPSSVLYSIAASVTQPIFRGGILEGGIEYQQARWDELVQNYQKAAISAFQDVETALAAVEYTDRQEKAQIVAVETAQRAYEIADAQLASGTVDIVSVLNTQRSLFTAQDLLVQARLARLQAVVGLFRALGGGWQAGAA